MYISWDKGQNGEKFEDCCLVAREDWTEELISNLNIKIQGIVYCSWSGNKSNMNYLRMGVALL